MPCLEWAQCGSVGSDEAVEQFLSQANPSMWQELTFPNDNYGQELVFPDNNDNYVQSMDEAPGWHAPFVCVPLNGVYRLGFNGRLFRNQCWVYGVTHWGCEGNRPHSKVYIIVREVPPCLVFNCSFRVLEDNAFDALFTGLNGEEVLQVVGRPLPPRLTMGNLTHLIKQEALQDGRMQSRNQRVYVLLNGAHQYLGEAIVLWDKTRSNGWLQRK